MISCRSFINFLCPFLILILITSCGEDPGKTKPSNNISPFVTIVSPSADDLLFKTVSVEVEITLQHFDSAAVLIDDELIYHSSDEVFDFSYNTKEVDDGLHTLKVEAYDTAGVKSETFIEVEVMNTLLTYEVPNNAFYLDEEAWVFITDSEGEFWGAKQVSQGQTFSIETPENYARGKRFTIHQLSHFDSWVLDDGATMVQSFPNALPGKYYFLPLFGSDSDGPAIVGTHELTVNNWDSDYDYPQALGEGYDSHDLSLVGNAIKYETNLTRNGTDILYYFSTDGDRTVAPRYKLYTNVSAGGTATTDFSTFVQMNKKTYSFGEEKDLIIMNIWPTNGGPTAVDADMVEYTDEIPLYYPGTTYSEYMTWFEVRLDNKINTYYSIGATPPSSYKSLNAGVSSLSYASNTINVSTTGTYDLIRLDSYAEWTGGSSTYTLDWSYFSGSAASQQIKVPQFPTAIINAYPELANAVIDFQRAELTEYDAFDNYSDYLTAVHEGQDWELFFDGQLALSVDFSDDWGGKKTKPMSERLPGRATPFKLTKK